MPQQVLIVLGALQLALPARTTGAIYGGDDQRQLPCYKEVDLDGRLPEYCAVRNGTLAHPCTEISCPSQGPGSMFRSIVNHPLLLLNGLSSIVYYTGEVMLYQQPMGLVLLVVAALASSFVIEPMEALVGLQVCTCVPSPPRAEGVAGADRFAIANRPIAAAVTAQDKSVAVPVVLLGMLGAVCCVFEVQVDGSVPLRELWALREVKRGPWRRRELPLTDPSRETLCDPAREVLRDPASGDGIASEGEEELIDSCPPSKPRQSLARHMLAVLVPFLLLALVYSVWFVTQKLFNQEYRTNMFGYTCIDQVCTRSRAQRCSAGDGAWARTGSGATVPVPIPVPHGSVCVRAKAAV